MKMLASYSAHSYITECLPVCLGCRNKCPRIRGFAGFPYLPVAVTAQLSNCIWGYTFLCILIFISDILIFANTAQRYIGQQSLFSKPLRSWVGMYKRGNQLDTRYHIAVRAVRVWGRCLGTQWWEHQGQQTRKSSQRGRCLALLDVEWEFSTGPRNGAGTMKDVHVEQQHLLKHRPWAWEML